MAAHRYWRLYCRRTSGGTNYCVVQELQFRDTLGGSDLTGSGTVLYDVQTTGYEASKAFDDSQSTYWNTGNVAFPHYIGYDFGEGNEYEIIEVLMTSQNGGWYVSTPSWFDVQYSDNGSDWYTSWTVVGAGFYDNNLTLTFDKPTGGVRQLDGSGDYLQTSAEHADVNGAEVTLGFWVRVPKDMGNSDGDKIVEIGGYNTGDGGIAVRISSGGTPSLDVQIFTGTTSYVTAVSHSVPRDVWFPVVVRSDADGIHEGRLYFGTYIGQITGTRLTEAAKVTVGASTANPTLNVGSFHIDRIAIWNSILSDLDVSRFESGVDPSTIASSSRKRYWAISGTDSPELDNESVQDLAITGDCVLGDGPADYDVYTSRRVSAAAVYAVMLGTTRKVSAAGVYAVVGPGGRRVFAAGVYVVRGNTPPSAPGDVAATTPADLTSTFTWTAATDPDEDPLQYEGRWRQGATEIEAFAKQTFEGALSKVADTSVVAMGEWIPGIRAHDGITYGEWAEGAVVTIQHVPLAPTISLAVTGLMEITITTTIPGLWADDHEIYVKVGGAVPTPAELFVPANLAVDDLGPTPAPTPMGGAMVGETYHIGERATNPYGNTNGNIASITMPVAQLALAAVSYNTATLQLLGASYAVAVHFQTAARPDDDYDPLLDDVILTDSSRFHHHLADLTPSTELRSRAYYQEEIDGPWLGPTELLWATTAAPPDTSRIVHPTRGEVTRGTFCIVMSLASGRSVASISIKDYYDADADPIALSNFCFDTLQYTDGWYRLTVTTDLGTVLTQLFRIDNVLHVGNIDCEEAVAGIRLGLDPYGNPYVWESSDILVDLGLGCSVRGRPDSDCAFLPYEIYAPGYLVFPSAPSGGDMSTAGSQRISAYITMDPWCIGSWYFGFWWAGLGESQAGVVALWSKNTTGHGPAYWGVEAHIQVGIDSGIWLPPGNQLLALTITSPGLTLPISFSVPFPTPVLLPWTPGYYPWSQGAGSGSQLDLDVEQLDPPNGATYRVRCWADGLLLVDHTFTATVPFPPGLPGIFDRTQGGAIHFANIQLTDIPIPCALQLDVYEDDRETIAWSVSTDPAHPYPYLCDPQNYGEQSIDIVAGAATIGQAEVILIDKNQIVGDQDSGWLTARIQAVHGRRCRLRRFTGQVNPGWVTIVDGPAGPPQLDDYAAYRWVIKNTRETERTIRAFEESTIALLPTAVIGGFGYDPVEDEYLADPMVPIYGTFMQNHDNVTTGLDEIPTMSTGYVDVSSLNITITKAVYEMLFGALDWALEWGTVYDENVPYGDPPIGLYNWFTYRTTFTTLVLHWRATGSSDPWTEIQTLVIDGEKYDTLPGYPDPNVIGPIWQNLVIVTPSGDNYAVQGVFIGDSRTIPQLPTHGQSIEFYITKSGTPSETMPYHLDGVWEDGVWHQLTTGELLKNLYDGVYSPRDPITGAIVPTGIRYDPEALNAMTDLVRMRLTQTVDDVRAWSEEYIYAPTGWVPALDYDGRISPVSQVPPQYMGYYTLINNPITEPTSEWDAGEQVINHLVFTYPRLYVPTTPPEALDGIAVREIVQDFQSAVSVQRYGDQKTEYTGTVFGAMGDIDGMAIGTESAVKLAMDRWLYVGDRYVDGAQGIAVYVMRSASYFLRAGSWVLCDLSWFPDYVTRRRGMLIGGQVMAIADPDCAWRRLVIEEAVADISEYDIEPSEGDDGGVPKPPTPPDAPDEGDISNARVERVLENNLHRVRWDHDLTIQNAIFGKFMVQVDSEGPTLESRLTVDAKSDGGTDTVERQGYVDFVIDGDLTYEGHPDGVETLFQYRLALIKEGVLLQTLTCGLTDWLIAPSAPEETLSTVWLVSSAEGQLIPDPDPVEIFVYWEPQVTDPDDYRYWWDIRIEWFLDGEWYLTETVAQRSWHQSSPIYVPYNNWNTEVYARIRYENSAGTGPWKLSDTIYI